MSVIKESPLFTWSPISKSEGTLLRAFAILAIVFHNYLHWISDLPGENEFTYRSERVVALMDGLWNTPWDVVRICASYFGHYGVQVFFFLSGYGVTIKYGDRLPGWFFFQKSRWRALFPAIIIAALGYIIYESTRLGWQHVFQEEGVNLIRQMVGVSNFIPDNVYHPIGPWWFIGVILQFYLIAPLLIRLTQRYGNTFLYVLIVGAFLLELFVAPVLSFNINHSILGHLDVCALGMWFARQGGRRIPGWVMLVSAGLFIGGNFSGLIWITTGVTVILVVLPFLRCLAVMVQRHDYLHRAMMYVGSLSMFIFLCNGYLRRPLIEWAKQTPHWWTSIWTSFVFLGIVILWASALRVLERRLFVGAERK